MPGNASQSNRGALGSGRPDQSTNAVLTIPNLVTLLRLLLLPVSLYFALVRRDFITATILLAFISVTDFLDGYLARHLGQISELGKIIDPSADRVVILAVGITALVEGWIPLWLGAVMLVREALISAISAYLYKAKSHRLNVIWAGKAGTLLLLFALPAILLGEQTHPDLRVMHGIGIALALAGTMVLYWAAAIYVRRDLIPALSGK
ncbi:MAG: CDP-alcohol phosphatidyltransferase family protein [Nitrospiraceae bacterium]|nr:CDP-alcohol phosphatidyltransferase family protein [Nitrospiraceae bacterium]MDA8207657.1 CDP-alcohol phosphatidyltransferase family protein [Actinomycetota bacterium]